MEHLKQIDPEIAHAIQMEVKRQSEKIVLIASENYVSRAVIEAQSSLLTNKYAEGYPGRRFYGGCEYVDMVETWAIERAKTLFHADHANVQPHAGSQANMAVFFSVLKIGDTIMGMDLSHGGHLTHGSPASFSGRLYKVVSYGVDPVTYRIDMDQVEKVAREHQPRIIIAGGSSYPRIIDFEGFARVAKEVGAMFMVDMAHFAGLVAGGVFPSPVPHADFVTSTTHKTLRGPRGGFVLSSQAHAKKLDRHMFPGMQGGPLMHTIAAKAVAFKEAMQPDFADYSLQVVRNAKVLAEALAGKGLKIITGGTDCHLMLVDLSDVGMTGAVAEDVLDRAGITLNKNVIPFEQRSPNETSGIRIGTPAVTTRGMKEDQMRWIADRIVDVLSSPEDERRIQKTADDVKEFCAEFPIPGTEGT
ncbi:MAG: serine hydroxymethyltransferase [Deltaproteobacteria bacterium]|nr:serine hydroxymethyltransferase [Deltaproteobacteria bacterium]